MRAILEFNLPDDQMEFNRATQALDMACALFDILQLSRKLENKYDTISFKTADIFDGIQFMAEGIAEILEEHNIDIDKLIE